MGYNIQTLFYILKYSSVTEIQKKLLNAKPINAAVLLVNEVERKSKC